MACKEVRKEFQYGHNFNTINVRDMNNMFFGCSSLKKLNLNNFNTNNVIHMGYMLYGCSKELIMKIKTQYKNIKEIGRAHV